MGDIIALGIIALFLGGFIGWLVSIQITSILDLDDIVQVVTPIITAIIAVIVSTNIAISIENNNYKAYINSSKLTYELYYISLDNDKMTGLERIELVKQANEYNNSLSKTKAHIDAWYNSYIKEEYKQQIKQLQFIK